MMDAKLLMLMGQVMADAQYVGPDAVLNNFPHLERSLGASEEVVARLNAAMAAILKPPPTSEKG
jgi:hypothetical protein